VDAASGCLSLPPALGIACERVIITPSSKNSAGVVTAVGSAPNVNAAMQRGPCDQRLRRTTQHHHLPGNRRGQTRPQACSRPIGPTNPSPASRGGVMKEPSGRYRDRRQRLVLWDLRQVELPTRACARGRLTSRLAAVVLDLVQFGGVREIPDVDAVAARLTAVGRAATRCWRTG
jgi:hypothetical protein